MSNLIPLPSCCRYFLLRSGRAGRRPEDRLCSRSVHPAHHRQIGRRLHLWHVRSGSAASATFRGEGWHNHLRCGQRPGEDFYDFWPPPAIKLPSFCHFVSSCSDFRLSSVVSAWFPPPGDTLSGDFRCRTDDRLVRPPSDPGRARRLWSGAGRGQVSLNPIQFMNGSFTGTWKSLCFF